MEEMEAMDNLTIINLTLYQSLTRSQEKILLLSKKLHALQLQKKRKKPATKRAALNKNIRMLNKSATDGIMGESAGLTIPAHSEIPPIQDTK